MKHTMKHVAALTLSLLMLLSCLSVTALAAPETGTKTATILFTHDLHSHLLPAPKEGGGEFGGFARLETALNTQRAEAKQAGIPTITLDAGDFSMGSLFQTVYTSQATELRSLGAMGFDVTTLGNHEFEYRGDGLAKMLTAALRSGDVLPKIVQANYTTPKDPLAEKAVVKALNEYGVAPYTMVEKDGLRFAIFGVMGQDADDCAPMSGMQMEPIVDAAKRVVAEVKKSEQYDFIICLSHAGTNKDPGKSEDELLAKAVPEIDFILSGHTHSTLIEPKIVGNTVIGCTGEYCNNLGSVTIQKDAAGKNKVVDYRLLPINESVKDDPEMSATVANYKALVEKDYLSQFKMTYDQVLAYSTFDFTPASRFAAVQEEDGLGNLITDAYIYAVQQAETGKGMPPITAAFVNSGVIRASFPKGDITVSNVFDVSSIGSGADGTPGYPLIDVWLTGEEIKNVMEVDPSVGPLFAGAQLYSSGVSYSFNMNRMIFNRMINPSIMLSDGTKKPLEDGKLYRVITNLYSSQMLGAVTEKSFGILKVTPKDAQGNPIVNYEDYIIHMQNGSEVKEWYAVATYLSSFPTENGVPRIPARYDGGEGRKVRIDSWNPIEILRQANWITLLVLAIVVLLIALVVFLVYRIATRKRRKERKALRKAGKSYRGYRG